MGAALAAPKRFYHETMNFDPGLLRQLRGKVLLMGAVISLGSAASALAILQAGLLSRLIERVFLGGASLADSIYLLALLAVAIALRVSFAWGSERVAIHGAAKVKTELRQQWVGRLQAIGPAQMKSERSGELAGTAIEGIEALDAYYSQYLPAAAFALLTPVIILAVVFPLDVLSGTILLLTAPLMPVFMSLIGNQAQALTHRQWRTLSRMSAYFLDVLQGLTTLKTLGRSQAQIPVIERVSQSFRQATMRILRVTFLSALALELVATLSTAVVAVTIGLRLLYGRISFYEAFFILLLAPEFYQPLRTLGQRFHAGMSGAEAARRLFAIIDKPAAPPGQHPGAAQRSQPTAPVKVRFEDVHFSYEDGRAALRGVNFEMAAGTKTAVVGPSGSGKSTLASLLLRFIEPSQGRILVNDIPLSELPPESWLEQVAWAPQIPYLFNESIAANICLARPEASLEQVMAAARQANAHDFIQALPQGYDTVIGERGARLSAGQAQRIALARAFLKDAPLVILDEPTASLDAHSEALVQEALQRLLTGRSALIVAHRLNTVLRADQIVVIDRGRAVQRGKHAELAHQEGLYRRLLDAYLDDGEDLAGMRPAVEAAPGVIAPEIAPAFPGTPAPAWQPPASLPALKSPLLRLLAFAASYRGLLLLSALMGMAVILSGVGLMGASAYIISAAALHPSIAVLQVAIVGVRFFGISRGLFRYLERYTSHEMTFHLLARLRVWFYQALEPLAPARLLQRHSGDLLARILGDISLLENFYVRALAPPLTALLSAAAIAAFLVGFDWCISLAWLFFLFLAGIGVPLLARSWGAASGRMAVSQRADLSVAIIDAVQGMADLHANNRQGAQAQRIDAASRGLNGAQERLLALNALQSGLVNLLAGLAMCAVLTLAIPQVRAGAIDGVQLAVLALVALTSFEAVQPLPVAAQYMEGNLQAARRLFEIVDAPPQVSDPPQPMPLSPSFDLQVQNLSFTYPPAPGEAVPKPALENISFHLPEAGRLAIVGASGAGKSTLVSLLLRFWQYSSGEILLGGQELRACAQEEARRCFAVVSQNTYLFSASLADNLRLARPNASQEQIEAAARQAQIHDWIASLPDGYDTWIGEHGLRLSAGERQRLAIARALLKESPILILDEPAASLDAVTERRLLESLLENLGQRSLLLITHRLVGLESMDEILVLDGGRVVQRGRHEGLLVQPGLYRQMRQHFDALRHPSPE